VAAAGNYPLDLVLMEGREALSLQQVPEPTKFKAMAVQLTSA
jgi:hypothetical protein